jgi:Fic family protein
LLPHVAFPELGHVECFWHAHDAYASRSAIAAANGPYRSTVTPPILDYSPHLPSELAADVAEAEAALARFDQHARLVLGVDNPGFGPMSSILLRTESASSSQVENITVGARQLALAEIGQEKSDNARVVTANVRAMEAALSPSGRLDQDSILTMHRELLSGQQGWEQHAGRYRDQLVWVGSSAITPRGAAHVAPQPELVPAAMSDLTGFLQRRDIPLLAHVAIAHAQFETIHPFVDGNGRTGRALVHAMLAATGVLRSTTAPISAGLLRDCESYFAALGDFRTGDAGPIISSFANASLFAAESGAKLVDDLAAQVEHARERLAGLRTDAAGRAVLPHLVSHPVVNARLLITLLGMNDVTAQRALEQLTRAGVLVEQTGRRRNRIYQHDGILHVLDAYAQQLRRQ